MLLKFYADESYNTRTFNFGGWLAEESEWNKLESQWKKRIAYERRKHGKLDRYHASDCSNLYKDYKNWTVTEQIQHTKKLLAIITRREVIAISSGVDLLALARVFPEDAADPLVGAYNLAVRHLMMMIRRRVKRDSVARVAIIHDRAEGYNGVISDAFHGLLKEGGDRYSKLFTTIAPMGWEDCVPLQPADMIAFDTYKFLDRTLHSSSAIMRKSLQNIVGNGIFVEGRYFNEALMRRLVRMHERRVRDGLTSEEAVKEELAREASTT